MRMEKRMHISYFEVVILAPQQHHRKGSIPTPKRLTKLPELRTKSKQSHYRTEGSRPLNAGTRGISPRNSMKEDVQLSLQDPQYNDLIQED